MKDKLEQGKRTEQTESANYGCVTTFRTMVFLIAISGWIMFIFMQSCSGEIYHTPTVSKETCPTYPQVKHYRKHSKKINPKYCNYVQPWNAVGPIAKPKKR